MKTQRNVLQDVNRVFAHYLDTDDHDRDLIAARYAPSFDTDGRILADYWSEVTGKLTFCIVTVYFLLKFN